MNSIISPFSPSSPPIFSPTNSAHPNKISCPSGGSSYFPIPWAAATISAKPTTKRTPHSRSRLRISSFSASDEQFVIDDLQSASEVVRGFYDGINRHDLPSVHDLIAENCVYEDLVFSRPFVGRKEILLFFKKFNDSISTDLQFVIDGLSTQDSSAVGVIWHLEWKGKAFPFSKGCSFYRLEIGDGKRQIIYARDTVEPAIKPGELALIAIRGVAWLLERFPQLADRIP